MKLAATVLAASTLLCGVAHADTDGEVSHTYPNGRVGLTIHTSETRGLIEYHDTRINLIFHMNTTPRLYMEEVYSVVPWEAASWNYGYGRIKVGSGKWHKCYVSLDCYENYANSGKEFLGIILDDLVTHQRYRLIWWADQGRLEIGDDPNE